MREIKFRAFIKELGEIHDVTSLNFVYGEVFHTYVQSTEEVYYAYKNEFELIRYTGLKDVNGREIYEGDIVKCFVKGDSKVIFKYGCFCLESLRYKNITAFCDIFGEMEVIGNIYEHSHLLED